MQRNHLLQKNKYFLFEPLNLRTFESFLFEPLNRQIYMCRNCLLQKSRLCYLNFLKGNIVKSRSKVKNERYFPLLLGSTTSRELALLCKVCKDVTNIYVTSYYIVTCFHKSSNLELTLQICSLQSQAA